MFAPAAFQRSSRPPWGEVVTPAGGPPRLAFSEAELAASADRWRPVGGVARRYRGLAALDAAVLAATCISPAGRRTSHLTAAGVAELIATFTNFGP